MEDRIVVSRDVDERWRWRRFDADDTCLAQGGGFTEVEDCMSQAVRVNAEPYVLEVGDDAPQTRSRYELVGAGPDPAGPPRFQAVEDETTHTVTISRHPSRPHPTTPT